MADTSLYTLLKSGVPRPVEINFSDGQEPIRFKPYEAQYVEEERLRKDTVATAQLHELLSDGVLRIVGIHLTPTEVISIEDAIDEILKGRESTTRGILFLSLDDRMEAMENDLLDVVSVSDLPEDEFNTPDDIMYTALLNEIKEARKNQMGDYSYPSLKKRLDALCDAIQSVTYDNIDISALQSLPERFNELEKTVNDIAKRIQSGSSYLRND